MHAHQGPNCRCRGFSRQSAGAAYFQIQRHACLQSPPQLQAPCRSRQLPKTAATKLEETPRSTFAQKQGAVQRPAAAEGAGDMLQPPIPEQPQHVVITDNFAPELCQDLRQTFDQRMGDPRKPNLQERCVWDHWYAPDGDGTTQYHLLRTQAQVYFSPEQHEALVDALLRFGESQLGCRAITPIWLSNYVDGCVQELHCDNPHGPFAFVLSLTNWDKREFTGGETQILKPLVASYWHSPALGNGLEHRDLMTLVAPEFARLTVFDPRLPHGVRLVRGTQDPRKGRLVLHGWFTDPTPFCQGGLSTEEVQAELNAAISGAISAMQEPDEDEEGQPVVHLGSHPCTGLLSYRIHVDGATGEVTAVHLLADTLVPLPSVGVDSAEVRAAVHEELCAWLGDAKFKHSKSGEDTRITLPVVFS